MVVNSLALISGAALVVVLAASSVRARRLVRERRRRGQGSPLDSFDIAVPTALTVGLALLLASATTQTSWPWLSTALAALTGVVFVVLGWGAFRGRRARRPMRMAGRLLALAAAGLACVALWTAESLHAPPDSHFASAAAMLALGAAFWIRLLDGRNR